MFEIEALGEDGQFVSVRSHILGEVEGVTYQQNIPYLMLGDDLVSPSAVVEVLNSRVD
jgi:hypothetical protein